MATREINDFSEPRVKLLRHLRSMQAGDETTYDEMEKILGFAPGSKEFTYIYLSVSQSLRREGMVFTRRQGRKVRRMTDTEIVTLAERGVERLQDSARRIATDAERASRSNDLSDEARITSSVVASIATLVATSTSPAAIAQVRAEVARTGAVIPLHETLTLFSRAAKHKVGEP